MSICLDYFSLSSNIGCSAKITYSYLKASIGRNLDAFLAGCIPKNIPTNAENKKATVIDHVVIVTGNSENLARILALPNPSNTPRTPPAQLNIC